MPLAPPSLAALWRTAPAADAVLSPALLDPLPDAARRWLSRAIAPGAPLARAVRLRMHGEIRLRRWRPFRAEQVIRADRGFRWDARVPVGPLAIRGWDASLDGEAAMRWALLGLVPVMRAAGPDIDRSAAGRAAAERIWLPTALLAGDVAWRDAGPARADATLAAGGHETTLELEVEDDGRLFGVRLMRWGNEGDGPFSLRPYGALVEAERTFGGFTIPTSLRIGWHFDGERFADDGEAIRITVDHAEFR